MNNERTIILGANGQLGRALQAQLPEAIALDQDTLDISDSDRVANYAWPEGGLIINAAAYTNVDGAESPEGRMTAWQANAVAVGNLALAATKHDMTLVHISSEYVFDGSKTPHTEEEALSPLGAYAKSKAGGDLAASLALKHYILRTSWVVGDGNNFVRTMSTLASRNISPTVVSDQIGRLTFTQTLVDAIEHLVSTDAEYGTYNVSNGGDPVSWADVARETFKLLGRDDLHVTDTTTKEYFAQKPESAPRPLNSTLDLSKITATGLALRDWHDDLAAYIAKEQAKEQA